MITLKILANSNLEALETIDNLFPKSRIQELRIDNSYVINKEKVYTVTIKNDKSMD